MAAGLVGPANWALVKAEALAAISARHQGRSTGDAPTARALQESVAVFGGKSAPEGSFPKPYDWEPFFEHFGDATPQDAVTSTLIAFGKLTCIVHGYNESFDLLSRVDRAKRLQNRAEAWLFKMMKPLFGAKNTVKVHMLLSHAAEEILDRNDLDFADTSVNEAAHKLQKAAYARTNRQTRGHARQLLTIAQSRLLLAAEDGEVAARESRVPDTASDVEETVIIERDTCKDSDSDKSYESDMDGPELPRWDAGIDSLQLGSKGPRGGKKTPLHQIAEWPGLSGAAEAVGVPRHWEVNLLSATHFQAVFE